LNTHVNLFVILILVPLTGLLLLIWLVTGKKVFGKILGLIWLGIFGLIFLVAIITIHFFPHKRELDRDDIYGEYIIDRTKFPGKQADWQYDHFRFEITKQNEFLFHLTDKGTITKTYKGTVEFLKAYNDQELSYTLTHQDITSLKTSRHFIELFRAFTMCFIHLNLETYFSQRDSGNP